MLKEHKEFYKKIETLQNVLKDFLNNAEDESLCSDEENDMYADMQNLVESIDSFLESEV